MKHYFCSITEVSGEFEFDAKFLMKQEEDKMEEAFLEMFRTFRGDGEFEDAEKSIVWYDFACAGRHAEYDEVSEEDFNVLSKYLSVLG